MSFEGKSFSFPGADADPASLLKLAEQYRLAANALFPLGTSGNPLTYAPYRLVAIHAIELHLNAFLRAKGHSPSAIRGMQHNFARRTDTSIGAGLVLRKRTAQHLRELTQTREYLAIRYDPKLSTVSQLNRLEATLKEIADKTAMVVKGTGDLTNREKRAPAA